MVDEPADVPRASPPTTRQVWLGVFIIFQLLFLVLANLLGMIKEARSYFPEEWKPTAELLVPGWTKEEGHYWEGANIVDKALRRYAQATGQYQEWSLFAPSVGDSCAFPAVQFVWDDDPRSAPAQARPLATLAAADPLQAATLWQAFLGQPQRMPAAPETFLSDNEPRDLHGYVRWGNFRLRRYENNLALILLYWSEETVKETEERWRDRIERHVRENYDILLAYMRWRVDALLPKNDSSVDRPSQVILLMRSYKILAPDDPQGPWQGPTEVPIARWQPHVVWDSAHRPLEWYNPVTKMFESLRK